LGRNEKTVAAGRRAVMPVVTTHSNTTSKNP
jgi:hypothetical protein